MVVTYRVPLERHAPAARRDSTYRAWERWRQALNEVAPRASGEVLQVAVLEADPYCSLVKVAVLVGPYQATTGS